MKKINKFFLSMLVMTGLIIVNVHSATIYVKSDAVGSNNGTSWTDAYTSLQSALNAATSGDQIWVAKGTYKPSYDYGLGGGSRFNHFRMINGVAIYGGFAGNESSVSERVNYGQGEANETILSGDLNDNGRDDNDCYHVFYHPSNYLLNNTAVLDGFTITGGNANHTESGSIHQKGGGMLNQGYNVSLTNSPFVVNCTFFNNASGSDAGGMYNINYANPTLNNCKFISNISGTTMSGNGGAININNSSPIISNCIFKSNYAYNGGGILITGTGSSPTFTNCLFTSNSIRIYGSGGAIFLMGYSTPTFTNCTFTLNITTAEGSKGGAFCVQSSNPVLNNCIVWGNDARDGDEFYLEGYSNYTTTLNYCCYGNESGDVSVASGTFSPSNCITSDPQFVDSGNGDFRILGTSPCCDTGNDTYNSQTYDIRGSGFPRKLDKNTGNVGTIDIGAYEYKFSNDPLPVELFFLKIMFKQEKVVLNWQTSSEVNNYGFEVQRTVILRHPLANRQDDNWEKIGFVQGSGNSNSPKGYSFTDNLYDILSNNYNLTLKYRLKQIDNDGSYKYSDVKAVCIDLPTKFELFQNYPNPFNPITTINYQLPKKSFISIKIYDAIGRVIETLVGDEQMPGNYEIKFDGSNLASGIYFYKLISVESDGKQITLLKKMILLK